MNGIGRFGSTDSKQSIAGTDTQHAGVIGGIDFPLIEKRLTGGVVAGYLGSRTDRQWRQCQAKDQAGFLGLYSRYEMQNGIRFDGTAIGGCHDSEIDRRIVIGTAGKTAHGDYDGYSLGGSLQASKGFGVTKEGYIAAFRRHYRAALLAERL